MTPAQALEAMLARAGLPPVGRRAWDLTVFGVRNATNSNRFDDALGVAYRDVDDGPVKVEAFRATTDPGRAALLDPSHPRGVFHVAPGRHPKVWRPGLHKQDPERPALRQVGVFAGYRDNDRDDKMERGVAASDAAGVNLHGGMDPARPDQRVDRYSEGCQVTAQAHVDRVLTLVAKQKAAGMGDCVSYTLFDAAEDPEARAFLVAVGVGGRALV